MGILKRFYKDSVSGTEYSIGMHFPDNDEVIKIVQAPCICSDAFCGSFLASSEADSYSHDGNFIVFTKSKDLAFRKLKENFDHIAARRIGRAAKFIREEILPNE